MKPITEMNVRAHPSSQLKYRLAFASGIPQFVNWMNRNRLLVVTYHGLYDGLRRVDLPSTFTHVQDMKSQLIFIRDRYRIINPDELLEHLDKGKALPSHSALVTFDDGYKSFHDLAFPILQALQINAIVFLPTVYIEKPEPFWFDLLWLYIENSSKERLFWLQRVLDIDAEQNQAETFTLRCLGKMKQMPFEKRKDIISEVLERFSLNGEQWKNIINAFYPMTGDQVKLMSTAGIFFGGHTHTHTILSSMSDKDAEKEIQVNKRHLKSLINRPCLYFAYPNGGLDDFTEKHKEMLKNEGFKAAFSLTQKRSDTLKSPMDVSRINVVPEDSSMSLSLRCTGITPMLAGIKDFRQANFYELNDKMLQ